MTPLVLITGFLGSGKTSLLRLLVPLLRSAGLRPHIVLNDYANASLDSATLRDLVPDIVPITGSCVCCDSMDDLLSTLLDSKLGERDVVLVEANGTTDPMPLLETFLLTRLRQRFPCLLQINLIDVKHWQQRGPENELEWMQGRTASHLLFTWLEAVAAERRLSVRNEVRKLNPRAVEVEAEVFANELIALTLLDEESTPPVFTNWQGRVTAGVSPAGLPPLPGTKKPAAPQSKVEGILSAPLLNSRHHPKHALAHRFRAIQLEVPRGIRPLQLVSWLESLPPAIVRAKGIVQFEDQPGRFHCFQRVADVISFHDMPVAPPDNLTLALLVGVAPDEEALRTTAARLLLGGRDGDVTSVHTQEEARG
jgi:G3E family GTPase